MKTMKWVSGLLLVTLVAACAVADNARTGLRAGDAETSLVRFTAPPLAGAKANHIVFADPFQLEEYAHFEATGGRAEVIYMTTRQLFVRLIALENWIDLDNMVRSWNYNRAASITFGEAFYMNNGWIDMWAKPFRRGAGEACAAFRAEWDHPSDDPEQRPGKMMFGYYCQKGGGELTRTGIEAALSHLHVRGISAPGPAGDAPVAAVSSQPSQVELAEVVSGAATGGATGNPDFPYEFARVYTDSGRCEDGGC